MINPAVWIPSSKRTETSIKPGGTPRSPHSPDPDRLSPIWVTHEVSAGPLPYAPLLLSTASSVRLHACSSGTQYWNFILHLMGEDDSPAATAGTIPVLGASSGIKQTRRKKTLQIETDALDLVLGAVTFPGPACDYPPAPGAARVRGNQQGKPCTCKRKDRT